MKISVILLFQLLLWLNLGRQTENLSFSNDNQFPAENGEWVYLFDGETVNGLRGDRMDTFPYRAWKIENGVLTTNIDGTTTDLITEKRYSDFELILEYKLSENANSGVKYFVLEYEYYDRRSLGIEYQLLDGDPGKDTYKHAALYDILPTTGKIKTNPVGQWNELRIVSKGNHAEHWLNGELVLSFTRGSKEYREAIARSKFNNIENFGEVKEGHILLQYHGSSHRHGRPVSFRNIKIRKL